MRLLPLFAPVEILGGECGDLSVELTIDGAYCYDSCNTQAWSASTILDVLEEMHRINKGEA